MQRIAGTTVEINYRVRSPTNKMFDMQEAYIVAGYRTAVTKSKKGGFRFTRPDDLAIDVIKGLLKSVPQLDP